ncbi:Uncharacterized protein QTN25_010311 [Entamoeba marina]
MQLERIYLMNVILYFDSISSVKTIIMMNHKGHDAVLSLKTNPYFKEKDVTKEIQVLQGIETIKTDLDQLKSLTKKDIENIALFNLTSCCTVNDDRYELVKNKVVKINKEVRYHEKVGFGGFCQLRTLQISMNQQLEDSIFWRDVGKLPHLEKLILSVCGFDIPDIKDHFNQINVNKVNVVVQIHHATENVVNMLHNQFPTFHLCCYENELEKSLLNQTVTMLPNKQNAYSISQQLFISTSLGSLLQNYHPYHLIVNNPSFATTFCNLPYLNLQQYTFLESLNLNQICLTNHIPLMLPSTLTALSIHDCPSFSSFPNIRKIHLRSLELSHTKTLFPTTITSLVLNHIPTIQNLSMFSLHSINLYMCSCSSLHLPSSISVFRAKRCLFKTLNFISVDTCQISHCSQLTSIHIQYNTHLNIDSCNGLKNLTLSTPCNGSVILKNCSFQSTTSFNLCTSLSLTNVKFKTCIPPPTLIELTLIQTPNFIPTDNQLTKLVIDHSIPFPTTLQVCTFLNCLNTICHTLPSLQEVAFCHCEITELPTLPISITTLIIHHCHKIQTLQLNHYSLKQLHILHCENLYEIDFPHTLTSFQIKFCDNLQILAHLYDTLLPIDAKTQLAAHFQRRIDHP